jgi:CheY-like chemotaxis protein
MDGYELVDRLRERGRAKHQLVIAVTVRQRDGSRPTSIDQLYLKPADPRVLLPTLARFARTLAPC